MTLVVLFILTGTMLGPELLASIPAAVYVVAIFMPLAGYASGYGLATLFHLPPNCKRTVSLETGSQNVQIIRCSFQNKKVIIQHVSLWEQQETKKNLSGKKYSLERCWLSQEFKLDLLPVLP